jgi:cobaltochelatase CobN
MFKAPPQTPPHKGEGLNLPHRRSHDLAESEPQVFSPLVGEMAGRPEGDKSHPQGHPA